MYRYPTGCRAIRTYIHTYSLTTRCVTLLQRYLLTYIHTRPPRANHASIRQSHPHPSPPPQPAKFPAPDIAPGRPKAYTVSMCLVCRSRPTEEGTVSGGLIFPNLPPAHLPRHRSCYGLCPPLSLADSATCVLESLTLCVRRKVSRLPTYLPNYL